MRERRYDIYVSEDVYHALRLLSKSQIIIEELFNIQKERNPTKDELADELLREVLKQRWPQLFEFQKEQEKAEKTLIESLRTNESK